MRLVISSRTIRTRKMSEDLCQYERYNVFVFQVGGVSRMHARMQYGRRGARDTLDAHVRRFSAIRDTAILQRR